VFLPPDLRFPSSFLRIIYRRWPRELQDADEVIDWVHRQSFCDGRIGLWGISYGANASLHASLRQATQLPPSASSNGNGNGNGAAPLAINVNDINVITDDDDHLTGAVGRAGSSGALIATTTVKRKRKVVTCVSLYGFWDLYRYEGRKLDAKRRQEPMLQ
jgi:hypothetical protein